MGTADYVQELRHMTIVRRQHAKIDPDWKRRVAEILKEVGILTDNWNGTITFNCLNGAVGDAQRLERIK